MLGCAEKGQKAQALAQRIHEQKQHARQGDDTERIAESVVSVPRASASMEPAGEQQDARRAEPDVRSETLVGAAP